jgi:hypothetical protein
MKKLLNVLFLTLTFCFTANAGHINVTGGATVDVFTAVKIGDALDCDTIITSGTVIYLKAGPADNAPWYDWAMADGSHTTYQVTYDVAIQGSIRYITATRGDLGSTVFCVKYQAAPTPPTAYGVTGGGSYCAGGAGVSVGLANSQTGVNYQLKIGAKDTLAAKAGTTGSALSWPNLTSAGTYTIVGTNGSGSTTMTGSATVSINPLPTVEAGNSQSVCAYAPVTLTATGVGTLSWVGKVGNPITIYPSKDTTLIAQATNGCGTVTDNVTITAKPLTSLTVSAGSTVCEGTKVTLNATVGSTNTLSWDHSLSGTSPEVTPTTTTTYTATSTATNGCGSPISKTITITVNPLPSLSVAGDNQTVCPYAATTISYLNVVGTGSWIGAVTGNPATIRPSKDTMVIAQATNGCGTFKDTIHIKVASVAPSFAFVSNDTSLCEGQNVTLYAIGIGSKAIWELVKEDSITVTPPVGTSVYTVKVSNTCGENSKSVTVTVNPKPAKPVITENASKELVSDALAGNQWYDGTGKINSATNQVYKPSVNGNYHVVVTSTFGCVSVASDVFNYTAMALVDLEALNIKVYPNPVIDQLTIDGNVGAISIIDAMGKVVFSTVSTSQSIQIDMSGFVPGSYFVNINGKSSVLLLKQ